MSWILMYFTVYITIIIIIIDIITVNIYITAMMVTITFPKIITFIFLYSLAFIFWCKM